MRPPAIPSPRVRTHVSHLLVDEVLEGGSRGDAELRGSVVNLEAERRVAVEGGLCAAQDRRERWPLRERC